MREIKFRQRVVVEDKTSYWHYWGILGEGQFVAPVSNSLNNSEDSQQFTGLKDKNGKEIYEGDIVKYRYEGIERENFKIEFIQAVSAFQLETLIQLYDSVAEECEVIGNIYEDSQLIDNKELFW